MFDGISPLRSYKNTIFFLHIIYLPSCIVLIFESLHITLFRCILSHLLLFFKKRPMINYAFDTYIILFHFTKNVYFVHNLDTFLCDNKKSSYLLLRMSLKEKNCFFLSNPAPLLRMKILVLLWGFLKRSVEQST